MIWRLTLRYVAEERRSFGLFFPFTSLPLGGTITLKDAESEFLPLISETRNSRNETISNEGGEHLNSACSKRMPSSAVEQTPLPSAAPRVTILGPTARIPLCGLKE